MAAGQGYEFSNVKSTLGDERAKARYEAFDALETARKRYDNAREQLEAHRQSVRLAEGEVNCAVKALETARASFDRLQALHADDAARLVSVPK